MRDLSIVHTAVEGQRDTVRERATWRWFASNEPALRRRGWSVDHRTIAPGRGHEYDYDAILREYWSRGRNTLSIERDMIPPSLDAIDRMADCGEEVCALDYALTRCFMLEVRSPKGPFTKIDVEPVDHGLVCVGHLVEHSMMRNRVDGAVGGYEWNPGGWTYCTTAPLGMTLFRWSLMQRFPEGWPRTTFVDLDSVMSEFLSSNGVRTHIHSEKAGHRREAVHGACVTLVGLPSGTKIVPLQHVEKKYRATLMRAHRANPVHDRFPLVVL